jgi:hypothetical protein
MQDPGYGLPRIPLLRTPVNRSNEGPRCAAFGPGSLSFFFGEGNAPFELEVPRYLLVAVGQVVDLSGIQELLEQFRFLLGRKIPLIENPKPLVQLLRWSSAFRHGGSPLLLVGVFRVSYEQP